MTPPPPPVQTPHSTFFEAGLAYANSAPYAAPVHQIVVHRFRCVAIAAHPNTGTRHAFGWTEVAPGIWIAGAIPDDHHYRPELWSEIR